MHHPLSVVVVHKIVLPKAVNGQGLHEGQGEEQDTAEVVRNLRLAGDAINAAAGGNALADAGADRREADGEAGADGRERRDPDTIVRMCLGSQQRSVFKECSLRREIAWIQETGVKRTPHHPLVLDVP